MSSNKVDTFSHDTGSSEQSQGSFQAVAAQLEALLNQRDQDVAAAMAEFQADGVSEDYRAKEREWYRAGGEVREIIRVLRGALAGQDEIAVGTQTRAKGVVDAI